MDRIQAGVQLQSLSDTSAFLHEVLGLWKGVLICEGGMSCPWLMVGRTCCRGPSQDFRRLWRLGAEQSIWDVSRL